MVERKAWYLREDFWAAIGTALAVILADSFGVELKVEALVSLVMILIAIITGTTVVESKAMEARKEIEIMKHEVQLKSMDLSFRQEAKEQERCSF